MNNASTAPYSSEYVCNNLARRTLRGLGGDTAQANASMFVERLIMPIGEKLSTSGRMPRGVMAKLCQRAISQLEADSAVVEVEYTNIQSSKLSANERHRLSYIISTGTEDEHWLEFVATEAWMSRKEVEVSVTTTDFRIHRHALSRYMQRERKPAESMFGDMMDALYASALLGISTSNIESEHIALPVASGMLFGRALVFDTTKHPPKKMKVVMNKYDLTQEEAPRGSLLSDHRVQVEMMTYVSQDALTPARRELHTVLSEFLARHKIALKQLFHACYYERGIVDPEVYARFNEIIAAAITEAREIILGPVWSRYTDSVGYDGGQR
jgi:hypothetical protein